MLCYFNNIFIEVSQVKISPDMRGFRYGDGAFETIRVVKSKPYALDLHMMRLKKSLQILRIDDLDWPEIIEACNRLPSLNQTESALLRIYVSRGASKRGLMPDFSAAPIVFIEVCDISLPLVKELKVVVSPYPYVNYLDGGKSANQQVNIMSKIYAHEQNCDDALMLSPEGKVLCLTSANLFFTQKSKLVTAKNGVVRGIIRQKILELWPGEVEERAICLEDLKDFDGCFATNVNIVALDIASIGQVHYNKRHADIFLAQIF